MFREKNQIKNVFSTLVIEQGFLIITKEDGIGKLIINNKEVPNATLRQFNLVMKVVDNSLYYSDYDGGNYGIDLETGSTRPLTNLHLQFKQINGNVCVASTKGESVRSAVADLKTGKILLSFPDSVTFPLFTEDYFFISPTRKWDKISCYDRKTWKLSWEYDATDVDKWISRDKKEADGAIVTMIGYWNNLLLLHVTRDKIIALDNSGKIAWSIDNIIDKQKEKFFAHGNMMDIRFVCNWQMDNETSKLYLTVAHFIFEFDLATRQKKLLHDYSNEPENNQWWFKWSALQGNWLLFTGSKGVGWPDSIGIFDLATKEIIWSYTMTDHEAIERERNRAPEEDPHYAAFFVEEPVVAENKLYVKDSNDTLHVFEKV